MDNEKKCPFPGKAQSGTSNQDWWPNQLTLKTLHQKPPAGDPGREFHAEELARSRCLEEGHRTGDDDIAGLAGRLWALRRALIRMAWHSVAHAASATAAVGVRNSDSRL
jgi:catalase-peroxidase